MNQPIGPTGYVSSGAGVWPIDGTVDKSGANRVEQDVSNGSDQVSLVHRKRRESLLPQMAHPAMAPIDHPCILAMSFTERSGQSVRGRGHTDQVHVIRHQTVGPDVEVIPLAHPGQEDPVGAVVAVREEDPHAPRAALRQVMRYARENRSRESRHRLGGGVSLLDTLVELAVIPDEGGEVEIEASQEDYVALPLLHLHLGVDLSRRFLLFAEVDGIDISTDRYIDATAQLRYQISRNWDVGLGYRMIDRTIDTADIQNEIRREHLDIALGYRWWLGRGGHGRRPLG